jgi:hypothetical protein
MLTHFLETRRTGAESSSEGSVGLHVLRVVEAAVVSADRGVRTAVAHIQTTGEQK